MKPRDNIKKTNAPSAKIPTGGSSVKMGDDRYGYVNINKRIILQGHARKLGANHYLLTCLNTDNTPLHGLTVGKVTQTDTKYSITGVSPSSPKTKSKNNIYKVISAFINGDEYEGEVIEVCPNCIIVDGNVVSNATNDIDSTVTESSTAKSHRAQESKQFKIKSPSTIGSIISSAAAYKNWHIGDVNIDFRIKTDGMLKILGKNKYVIWPVSKCEETKEYISILGLKNSETVDADIDGKKYNGVEILVEGSQVTVNNKCNFSSYASDMHPANSFVNLASVSSTTRIYGMLSHEEKIVAEYPEDLQPSPPVERIPASVIKALSEGSTFDKHAKSEDESSSLMSVPDDPGNESSEALSLTECSDDSSPEPARLNY